MEISKSNRYVAIKFAGHGPIDYIDLTVFPPAPPSGQTFDFQNKVI